MSGKIIMKRKREEDFANRGDLTENAEDSSNDNKIESNCDSCKRSCVGTSQSTIPDRPPTPPTPQSIPRNELLIEALKRIVELQNELDDFERDLDDNDRYQYGNYDADSNVSMYQDEIIAEEQSLDEEEGETENLGRSEAEALGFAMCARETLIFLEREGIPTDSLLYRSLRSKLVGQADGLIPI